METNNLQFAYSALTTQAERRAIFTAMHTYTCSISLLRTFRRLLSGIAVVICSIASSNAASDADVTIIKAEKVVIEENVITIVAEARTTVLLISDDYKPDYQGQTWHGMPVTRVKIASAKATFIIKRPPQPGLEEAWQGSLKAAKELQEGKEVGRIGYYAPDMTIKGNLLDSVTGFGYLYPKGK